jgi:hypothetical protein
MTTIQGGQRSLKPFETPASRFNASQKMEADSVLAEKCDCLVTRIDFGRHKQHGISLALMAKVKNPKLKVVFIAREEFREQATEVGEFLPILVEIPVIVATVQRGLLAPVIPLLSFARRERGSWRANEPPKK